jgi:hypothetical protein
VDDKTIMKAGNITHFPKVKTSSDGNTCTGSTSEDGTFTLYGEVDLHKGASQEVAPFSFTVTVQDENRVDFEANVPDAKTAGDYLSLSWDSPSDEEIYGLGLQYSVWNHKGSQVPLITTEAGVGRGLQPITAFLNIFGGSSGGTATTSYAPAAQFITSKQRGIVIDNVNIGIADFTSEDRNEVVYWHEDKITGTFLYGKDFMELSQTLS